MPFFNTEEPIYEPDSPLFLREQKKAAFVKWVQVLRNSDEMSEETLSNIILLRWNSFSAGGLNEDAIVVDVISAHRMGHSVNLQTAYEDFLRFLKTSQERGA